MKLYYQLACLLLAFSSVVFSGTASPRDAASGTSLNLQDELRVGAKWRKLLQDPDLKPPKKDKKTGGLGKAKPKKTAERKDSFSEEKKSSLKPEIRKVLDEEDDEDLRFMEEERQNKGKPQKEAKQPKTEKKASRGKTSEDEDEPQVEQIIDSDMELEELKDTNSQVEEANKSKDEGDDITPEDIPDDREDAIAETKTRGTGLKKNTGAVKKSGKASEPGKKKNKGVVEEEDTKEEEPVKLKSKGSAIAKEVPEDEEESTLPTPVKKKTPAAKGPKKAKPEGGKMRTAKKDMDVKPAKPKNQISKQPEEPATLAADAAVDVEELQLDTTLPKPEIEEEEDGDFDFVGEFSALPSKLQETAGHVANKLGPGIQKLSEKSKGYFSQANQQMAESLVPLVGEQVAPVVASLISYALLLIPLIVVLYMLERIRAALSLAKVLFFVNLYLTAYFMTLVLATFVLHGEPMAFFFRNSPSSYVFLQLLQAFGYFFYLLLYAIVFAKACSSESIWQRLLALLQLLMVALFGLHYYLTVFHRAMAMKYPRTSWKIYCCYSAGLGILCLLARAKIELSKKEYFYTPADDPDEAIPVDKRS